MRGWRKESVDPKEVFPIENLPIETFGDRQSDALALLYHRYNKERDDSKPSRPPVLSVDKRKEDFFRRILPILDGFDNIFRYVDNSNLQGDETVSNWLKTLESLYRRLQSALEKEGLTAIESEGMLLDLSLHEVVDTREDPGVKPNTIVEEVVKGYRYGKRVLRDAKVIVSKRSSTEREKISE